MTLAKHLIINLLNIRLISYQVGRHEIPTDFHVGWHLSHEPQSIGHRTQGRVMILVTRLLNHQTQKLGNVWEDELPIVQVQQRDLRQNASFLYIQAFRPPQFVRFPGNRLDVYPRHLLPLLVHEPAVLVIPHDWSTQCFGAMHSQLHTNTINKIIENPEIAKKKMQKPQRG